MATKECSRNEPKLRGGILWATVSMATDSRVASDFSLTANLRHLHQILMAKFTSSMHYSRGSDLLWHRRSIRDL